MALARVQSKSAKDATGTSTAPSCTFDATPAQDNLLVAYVAWNQNADSTVALSGIPAGWTLIPTDGDVTDPNDVHHAVYYKVAGAAESPTFSATLGQAERWGVVLLEYSGFVGVPTLDVSAQGASTTTATTTGTTAATAAADEVWLGFISVKNIATQTLPTNGFTSVVTDSTSGAPTAEDVCFAALEKIVAATGTAGTGTTLSTGRAAIGTIATFQGVTVRPANTDAPVASGTATVGETLSATDGTWTGTPPITFAYLWQRSGDGTNWTNIGGATAATYVIQAVDLGLYIRIRVTATGPGGGRTALSNAIGPVTSLPSGPNLVALAIHEDLVSWDKATGLTGWFVLSSSLLSGTDLLAPASQLVPTFSGIYDDLSGYFVEASWSRGRSSSFETVEDGQWTGTFRDPDGRFNPNNPASPLYGYTDKPERPFRHRAQYGGIWYPQFFGYITDHDYEVRSRGRGYLHLQLGDLAGVKLDVPAPVIAQLTATTSGGVIGAALDAIGWSDPAYRALDAGDPIDFWPGTIAGNTETLLSLIEEVLQIEFGLFWADAGGVARYEDRDTRQGKAIAYTITNEMRAIAPGVSLRRILNRATFTKEGSTPQVVTDTASADPVFGYGLRAAPEVSSQLLRNDDAAYQRANYVVQQRKDPRGDIYSLKIDNRTSALLQALLDLDFSDRVSASEAETGSPFDGYIERLERSVSSRPYRESANYMLSKRSTINPFLLSSSLLSGTDVLPL